MKITGFLWLEQFVEKLEEKHSVTVEEVEEAFENRSDLKVKRIQRGRYHAEHLYRAMGRTVAGRYLAIFFLLKRSGKALVISARDMDAKERRSYGR